MFEGGVGFLVAGPKGQRLLESIHGECNVTFVASYRDPGATDSSLAGIEGLCRKHGYHFEVLKRPGGKFLQRAELVFVAGWQYLLAKPHDRTIILHDSLLPDLRGFAPVVTALIRGDQELGVTALKATEEPDHGPICGQQSIPITYPAKIGTVIEKLANCYADLARGIMMQLGDGRLDTCPQDETKATYGIWRDEEDYTVRWTWDAPMIQRFVNAVGTPYPGAKATYRGRTIRIDDVEVLDDIHFVERFPGKIWAIRDGRPEVVCGRGLVRILNARFDDGSRAVFDRLRERL